VFIILAIAFFVIIVVNINSGNVHIPLSRIVNILLTKNGDPKEVDIIWRIRLPRILMAAMLGGALSLSGFLLQTFFENPIAGPFVLGISSGSPLGFVGAVFHFFNHSVFKSTLFVNSAAVEMQTKTTLIDKLGGLHKQMPVTGTSNILAFLSTAGIPPLAGFWSKLLIIIAVWQAHGGVVAGVALFASIFTAVYFLMVQRKVFFGPCREEWKDVQEAKFSIRLASVLLSCITVGVGCVFPWILRFLEAQGWI